MQAEEQGLLTPHSGDTIYEGTVGSTGISLATLCRAKGYLAYMYEFSYLQTSESDILCFRIQVPTLENPLCLTSPTHDSSLTLYESKC